MILPPEEKHQRAEKILKIVVLIDVTLGVQLDVSKHLRENSQIPKRLDRFSEFHSRPPGLGGHLHSNDGVYEEKHGDQEADIRKSLQKEKRTIEPGPNVAVLTLKGGGLKTRSGDLEGLHKGPQQDADGVALPQQLDQPGRSEKLQETHVDGVHRLGPARGGGAGRGGGRQKRETGC